MNSVLDDRVDATGDFRQLRDSVKNVIEKFDTRVIRSIVYVCLTIVASTGCTNFEHPLPWAHSPLHDNLSGSWLEVDGSTSPIKMDVSLLENNTLSFKLEIDPTTESSSSDSSFPRSTRTRFVYFNGDVLASNDVHILQVDMDSYEERNIEEGEPKSNTHEGYRFLRLHPADDSVIFRQIDIHQFARYAEARLSIEEISLTNRDFADCVDEKIQVEFFSERLNELLSERPNELFSVEERIEMEEFLQEYENREVEPYEELQRMRECIAYKLPGEVLGRLIVQNPEDSFESETLRMSRIE